MAVPETVRTLALAMPGTIEKPSYGTPGFFVKKKIFARLLPDGETVVIRIDFDERETLMQANPEAYFITDHYLNYPMMIVRLAKVSVAELRELLDDARQFAPE